MLKRNVTLSLVEPIKTSSIEKRREEIIKSLEKAKTYLSLLDVGRIRDLVPIFHSMFIYGAAFNDLRDLAIEIVNEKEIKRGAMENRDSQSELEKLVLEAGWETYEDYVKTFVIKVLQDSSWKHLSNRDPEDMIRLRQEVLLFLFASIPGSEFLYEQDYAKLEDNIIECREALIRGRGYTNARNSSNGSKA